MKKIILIALLLPITASAIFLALSVFMLNNGTFLPHDAASITGNVVDNDYNNLLSGGNLVRIGDKLYYNYYKNTYVYGLMEIHSGSAKRIYWNGPKWFGYYIYNYPISCLNGHLLMMPEYQVQAYSPDSGEFSAYEPLDALSTRNLLFQARNDSVIYLDEDGGLSLCVYNAGSVEVLVKDNVVTFYAMEDDIYYYQATDSVTSGEFRKYNSSDGTDVSVCRLKDISSVYHMMIEGQYLVFDGCQYMPSGESTYAVYKINLNSADRSIECVCSGDVSMSDNLYDIHSWNIYNGTIYVALHTGLMSIDILSNDKYKLYDSYVKECYVVDDTWVYFIDKSADLWRVPQAGGDAELVLG